MERKMKLQVACILSATVFAFAGAAGCNKNGSGGSGAAPNSCKINGSAWEATTAGSYAEEGITDKGAPALFLTLLKGDENAKFSKITVTLNTKPKAGTFPAGPDGCLFKRNEPTDASFFCKAGQVVITKADAEHVEGTFSIDTKTWDDKESVKITDGAFNLKVKK